MSFLRNVYRRMRTPRCLLSDEERTWVEDRMQWLAREFGPEVATREPLTPTPEHFPHEFGGTDEEAEALLIRLCTFMRLDPAVIDVEIFEEDDAPEFHGVPLYEKHSEGAAGLYRASDTDGRYLLALEESLLERPPELVSTICHELGHVHLLGQKRISPSEPDHEPLTDLLTVFFGAGIFTANAAFFFQQWQSNTHQGWRARRLGYLSEPAIGYALACYANLRGESEPRWARFLEPSILPLVEDSIDFIRQSGHIRFSGGAT